MEVRVNGVAALYPGNTRFVMRNIVRDPAFATIIASPGVDLADY